MASETQNYGYPKPEEDDFYDIGDFNRAMDMIDKDMKDANDAILGIGEQVPEFEQAEERENISPGDSLRVMFGKIKKFFADLKQVAFTGSYNDLANKPTIPAAVRIKGDAEPETDYHTGDVSLSPEDIGAPSTEYISAHFVPDHIKTVTATFNEKGWYRIAKAFARYNTSCTVTLKRFYNHGQSEYQKVQIIAGYTQSKIVPLIAYTEVPGAKLFTKMRLTRAPGAERDYLEVYYDSSSENLIRATIEDAIGVLDRDNWEMMTPFVVQEVADGLTTIASADLPANLDAGNYLQTVEGQITVAGKTGYLAYPSDAYYQASKSGVTGYIKITLPVSWTNTFIKFTVSIFNMGTGESCDYHISGYNYAATPAWTNCTAVCVGKAGSSHTNLNVRFGHNGTKCVIGIGEIGTRWDCPVIQIHDIELGYYKNDYETWQSGWNVSIGTSLPLTTSVTISNTHVAYGGVAGSCTGNAATATTATKATNDGNGNNIADTYLTKTGKAASATKADSATKATQDGNGNNIANTYETKAGNTWKAIKTVNYNGSNAIVNKNLYKEVRIMAYVANGSETTVYGTYDIQIDELDNFANEILYFGDTSKNDTYFYITLVGNSAIVENDYRGMTIKVFAK